MPDEFPPSQELGTARFTAPPDWAAATCDKPHRPRASINNDIPKRGFILLLLVSNLTIVYCLCTSQLTKSCKILSLG